MPHSFGKRARTRDLFSRKPKDRGVIPIKPYLQTFKVGQYVDVVANAAQQKGMPYKYYHGKTGRVWNISRRAVGVVITKVVGNRQMQKKIHVRIEHVRPSQCRKEFLRRVNENRDAIAAAKESGNKTKLVLKRQPQGPRDGRTVRTAKTTVEEITPVPYLHPYE